MKKTIKLFITALILGGSLLGKACATSDVIWRVGSNPLVTDDISYTSIRNEDYLPLMKRNGIDPAKLYHLHDGSSLNLTGEFPWLQEIICDFNKEETMSQCGEYDLAITDWSVTKFMALEAIGNLLNHESLNGKLIITGLGYNHTFFGFIKSSRYSPLYANLIKLGTLINEKSLRLLPYMVDITNQIDKKAFVQCLLDILEYAKQKADTHTEPSNADISAIAASYDKDTDHPKMPFQTSYRSKGNWYYAEIVDPYVKGGNFYDTEKNNLLGQVEAIDGKIREIEEKMIEAEKVKEASPRQFKIMVYNNFKEYQLDAGTAKEKLIYDMGHGGREDSDGIMVITREK